MANDKWYTTGLEGARKFREVEALRAAMQKQGEYVRRYRLAPGEKGSVIFLEHPFVWLNEHSVQADGHWESFTCTSDKESCPLCVSGNRQIPILVTTVIDTRKYTSKKTGKVYQYTKSLLVFKGKAIRQMMRQFLEGGKMDLTHYIMEIERDTDSKSVACGEFFSLGKKVSIPKLEALAKKLEVDPKDFLKPFDYFQILAPKSDKELRTIAGMGDPIGSNESTDLDDLDLNIDAETLNDSELNFDEELEDSEEEKGAEPSPEKKDADNVKDLLNTDDLV